MRATDLGVAQKSENRTRRWKLSESLNGQQSHEKSIPLLCLTTCYLWLCLLALNVAIIHDAASSFCVFAPMVSIFTGHLHREVFLHFSCPSLLLLSAMVTPFGYNYLFPACLPHWTLRSFKPVMTLYASPPWLGNQARDYEWRRNWDGSQEPLKNKIWPQHGLFTCRLSLFIFLDSRRFHLLV